MRKTVVVSARVVNVRAMILTALSVVLCHLLALPVTVIATPPLASPGTPRHIILAFDVSTSMKSGRQSGRTMKDVEKYLLDILYKKFPLSVPRPDTVDPEIIKSTDLDLDKPLYRPGDVLTYFTFDQNVHYRFQRKKGYQDSSPFSHDLPTFPRDFKGSWTFIDAAKLAAYDNFEPELESETFLVLVSDLGKEPPVPKGPVIERVHRYERHYHMTPYYSLRVGDKIWINVYKIRPLGDTPPRPPERLVQLLDATDRHLLKDLRFRVGAANSAVPASSYVIAPNPALKHPIEITKLTYAIKHRDADNPVVSDDIYSGPEPKEQISLNSMRLDRRFISSDYRMFIQVWYRSREAGAKTEEFRLQEIGLSPLTVCTFCVGDRKERCLSREPISLTPGRDKFTSKELRLTQKQSDGEGQCNVTKMELLLNGKKQEGSLSGFEPGTKADFRIALSRDKAGEIPACSPVKGILQVFYEDKASGGTSKIQEIPLVLTVAAPMLTAKDIHVGPPGARESKLTFAGSEGKLHLGNHWLSLDNENFLKGSKLEKVVVKIGENAHIALGPLSSRDLPARLNFTLSRQQAHDLTRRKIAEAAVHVTYVSTCSEEPQNISFSVPVKIVSPSCPQGLLTLAQASAPDKPLEKLKLVRDPENNLKIAGLALAVSGGQSPEGLVTQAENVELRVADVVKSWKSVPIGPKSVPLKEQILSPKESQLLQPGRRKGHITIQYRCTDSTGGPQEELKTLQVVVPPPRPLELLLAHQGGKPLNELSCIAILGKSSIDGLMLCTKNGASPQTMGATIKKIEVCPKAGGPPWKTWNAASQWPAPLDFRITSLGEFRDEKTGRVPGIVKVTYSLPGVQSEQQFIGAFTVKTISLDPLIYLAGFALVGGIGVVIWCIVGGCGKRKQEFSIDIVRGNDRRTTDTFVLSKGEKLLLYPKEGSKYCPDLDCSDCHIENRKGQIFLVRPGEPDEQVFDGFPYEIPENGRHVSLEIHRTGKANPQDPTGDPGAGVEPSDTEWPGDNGPRF